MRRPKVGDVVVVEWVDANWSREQSTLKESLSLSMPVVLTYGRLLERSAKRVLVAGEVLTEGDPDETESFRASTVIPAGMVRSVRLLQF